MNIKDIRLPVKLVSDVDDLHLTPDATTRKVNLNAFAPEGTFGVNVNLLGTKEVEELFSGGASLMGFCEDVERNAIILFVSDTNGKGKILRYYNDPNITELQTIFENDYFTLPNWVNADVVGDMLYWTDGYFGSFTEYDYNPPRKLNITKALNIGDNTVKAKNKYSYLGENLLCFSAAKPTHTKSPTAVYGDDPDFHKNYLRGKLYQFRVQYVYDDREKSAWSPISKIPLPEGENFVNGNYLRDNEFNNYIEVGYNTGNETVVSVNLAYREGNFGSWKLFKTIEKYDGNGDLVSGISNNVDKTYNFYGNEVAYALDNNEVERLFHDVPLVSKTQKFISGKSLVYGNYMAGYENTSDVSLSLSWKGDLVSYEISNRIVYGRISVPDGGHVFISLDFWHESDDGDGFWEYEIGDRVAVTISYAEWTNPGTTLESNTSYIVQEGDTLSDIWDVLKLAIPLPSLQILYDDGFIVFNGQDETYLLQDIVMTVTRDTDVVTLPDPVESSIGYYKIEFPESSDDGVWLLSLSYGDDTYNLAINSYSDTTIYDIQNGIKEFINNTFTDACSVCGHWIIISLLLNDLTLKFVPRENTQVKSFKSGSKVEVGIVYYDRVGRCGGVQASASVDIPSIVDDGVQDFEFPTLYKNSIDVTINGDPPQWARYYQLVVSPKRQTFFQYMVDSLQEDISSNTVRIYLNTAINDGITNNDRVNYGFYTYKPGDRVKFLYVKASWLSPPDQYRVCTSDLDMEIIGTGYDDKDESYQTDDADTPEFILDANGNKIKKEVSQYLIVKNFDYVTAGFDTNNYPFLEVYTPERADDDNNIFYEVGECYDVDSPHTANAEHHDTSINIEGDIYVRGRARSSSLVFLCEDAHFTDIYESNYWDRGRANVYNELAKTTWYSEYLKHSKNYLKNSVNGLSDFDSSQINLNGKYGEITALNESGYVLQVKQVRKDNSIYIGRVVLNQPDGTNQLSTTDALLGTIMPSQFSYGTVHPKSVVQNGSFTYYFDVYSGKVIRDAYNGPVVISDYGMATYFKEISERILANFDRSEVLGGFDGKNDSYILTFRINGTDETIIFNEKDNVWSHYADFTPVGYAYMGNTLLAVNDGKLWLHNDTTVPRNNFYGTQYESEIRLVFNTEPLKNKIYHNLEFKSSGNWFTREGDIKILNDDGTPRMVSYLPDSKFVVKEGSTFATFLRNMVNVGNYQKLINGEVLKGRYLVVTLRSADTDKAWLSHTVVNSIISERS